MEARNCKKCGKVYLYNGNKYCLDCINDMDKTLSILREYVYKNPYSNLVKIASDTGVPIKTILQFIREGRMEIKVEDPSLACMNCGAPINTGRMCLNCAGRVLKDVTNTFKKNTPERKDTENSENQQKTSNTSESSKTGQRLHTFNMFQKNN